MRERVSAKAGNCMQVGGLQPLARGRCTSLQLVACTRVGLTPSTVLEWLRGLQLAWIVDDRSIDSMSLPFNEERN